MGIYLYRGDLYLIITHLSIPGLSPGFFIILPGADLADTLVDLDPALLQMLVETRTVAGKVITGMAEIDPFGLVAGSYAASGEQLALLMSAAPAVTLGEVIQHLLEVRVFSKNRVAEQGFKTFGVRLEIAELFLQQPAVHADFTVHMRETCFAAQAAGSQSLKYPIIHSNLLFNVLPGVAGEQQVA